jgi:hypothetical protein
MIRGHCRTGLQQFEPRSLLEHCDSTVRTEVIVGHCSDYVNRGHCWITLLQKMHRIALLQRWPRIQSLGLIVVTCAACCHADVIALDAALQTPP